MSLYELCIKRPVFATVLSLLIVTFGVLAFSRLPLRELPNIDPPIVSVQTDYPGASASVVETRVTKPVEDAIAGIEGIDTISSNSRDGSSSWIRLRDCWRRDADRHHHRLPRLP